MSTKYKYGENGSYFDPETKRTYYKDPQYQKAYDDEWNRLEKLYKMKQEEQRKIEMANFQRVLAQADALTKSMQALGYKTSLPWEQKNRFDGEEKSEIERAPEDKIYITENSLTGKDEYIRGNGHPVSFDKETGELVDAITDERTSFDTKLPQEVVITGRKRYNPVYMSSPSALIPLPGILSPSVEEYVKAADNTASALSAANWMDTAYDAMYTPDEINYPWDEGNKGLGDPTLDLGFDLATGAGLSKLARFSKFANALDNGVNNTKRVDKGVALLEDNVDKLLSYNIKFDRVPFDRPVYHNPQFMSDLIYDLENMSGRQYISTSLARRWADGILYEDMMDYSPTYRNFIRRLSPYNRKIIERTPMYPLTDYPYTIDTRKGSWFSQKDDAILLDPEYYSTYNRNASYADNIGNTATHEGVHSIIYHNPIYRPLKKKYPTSLDMAKALKVNITNVPMNTEQSKIFEYLFEDGGNEIIARGSEFKNVANVDKFKTVEELKKAMRSKIKMHDNHISQLYNLIDKYGDWKTFMDFINQWSPAVIPAAIVTTSVIQSNNQQNK